MQKVILYIGSTVVDLFNDEVISLTQTIQNVRDISKIFTPFSKTFSVPASKANNKIFKHYYNFDIDNGFDARVRVNATIELNFIPFQQGKIQLEGVDMRQNKPYAYRITFYGNTVSLKDILGEDKLSSLSWLSGFTRTYNSSQVKTDLQANGIDLTNSFDSTLYTDAYVMPLIVCKTRLFYDSTLTGNFDYEYPNPLGGNLYYQGGQGSHHHGVYWEELKYGIRAYLIVKAIEESYDGIEFTSDSFLKDTSIAQYYNLYMWMHKNKGFVRESEGSSAVTDRYEGFSIDTTQMTRVVMVDDLLKVFNLQGGQTVSYTLDITRTIGSNPFTVTIKKDGIVYATSSHDGSGTNPVTLTMTGTLTNSSSGYDIYIQGEPTEEFDCEWVVTDSYIGTGQTGTFTGASQTLGADFLFRASEQVPEIKVIDFITGLFKMFNLTAYVQSDGKIKVQPLDDFYAGGTERDITDYVDITRSSIDVALPYKEINFQYKGRGTQVAALYEQRQGIGWGTEEYKIDNSLSGEVYNVQVPFEHMQFENLINEGNGSALSNLQVGNCLDDNDQPYIGQPILFYWQRYTGTSISFLTTITTGGHSSINTYCVPLNSVTGTSTDSNHFSVELNEFLPSTTLTGSLFANYYEDYVSDVFNTKRRLTKVKAYLPLKFLIDYSLADTLRIADRRYNINSITTNLQTGESTLELLNVV